MSGINAITVAAATIYFFQFAPLVVGLMLTDLAVFVAKSVFSIVDDKMARKNALYDAMKTIVSLVIQFVVFISSNGTPKSIVNQAAATKDLSSQFTSNTSSLSGKEQTAGVNIEPKCY